MQGTNQDRGARAAEDRDLASLRASEEKYSCLFHQSSYAIVIHDADGKIVDINQRALQLTGRSRLPNTVSDPFRSLNGHGAGAAQSPSR